MWWPVKLFLVTTCDDSSNFVFLPDSQKHSEQNELPIGVGERNTNCGNGKQDDGSSQKFCSRKQNQESKRFY